MNKNTAAILVMVAAIAIAAGSALFLPRTIPTASSNTFVTVIDGKFTLAGRPYYFAGANFWQGMNLGVDGPTGDRARLTIELDSLRQLGITNLRVMASSEGPDTEPYRILPSLMIAPGVYNQSVLDGLDFLLAEMGKRDMKAVMVLNNYWQWSGGMAQYVSWYEGTPIPYPGDYGTFMAYAARFYLCDECQTWYRHHIEMLINHTNPYTGLKYRDAPAIFAWELANEPRRYPDTWIDDTAAYIKSLDPNHMITTGSEGSPPGERQSFIEAHNGPNIAYTTVHIWPQNWGWYDPANPTSYTRAQASALDYFRQLEDQSARLDKPLVLEEFGLARDYESVNDIFNSNAATTHRDLFYTAMFDAVYNSASSGGSAAGFNFWAWAGHARPGDPWVGDPPHETPGWYSVYNTDDSTTGLITTYAEKMSSITAP